METKQRSLASHLLTMAIIFGVLFIGLGISELTKKPVEEVEYSSELEAGSPAYFRLKSIIPEYSISIGTDSYYSVVVCKCTTTDDAVVWLKISTNDYKEWFDSSATFGSTIFGNSFKKVEYADAPVVHGKTRSAEEVCAGLSEKTGNLILEYDYVAFGT